jgi:hypothetical protein
MIPPITYDPLTRQRKNRTKPLAKTWSTHKSHVVATRTCSGLLLARSVGSLPCSDTSGVGGEADMPRSLNRPR